MIFIKEEKDNSLSHNNITFDGTENIKWGSADKDLKTFIKGYNKYKDKKIDIDTPVNFLSKEAKEWIAKKSLLGNADANTFEELIFFPVVNPITNKLNENALKLCKGPHLGSAKLSNSIKDDISVYVEHLLEKNFMLKESFLLTETPTLGKIVKDLISGSYDSKVQLMRDDVRDVKTPEQRLVMVIKLTDMIKELTFIRHNRNKIQTIILDPIMDWVKSKIHLTNVDSTLSTRLSSNLTILNKLREDLLRKDFSGENQFQNLKVKIKDREKEILEKLESEFKEI